MKLLKIALIISSIVFSNSILANPQESALSEAQEQFVVADLNDICGDAWCEGEYNINFTSITMWPFEGRNVHVLNFVAYNSWEDSPSPVFVSCEIQHTIIAKIIASTTPEDMFLVRDELYLNVDACINEKL